MQRLALISALALQLPAAAGPVPPPVASFSDSTRLIRADSQLVNLDRLVVTATRTRRRMSETPASVSVVSKETIESSPAKGIDDLIARKPGVQLRRVVGIGEGIPSDIILRAIPGTFGSSRTLILVDGIPTNASGTPFLILNEIPLDAVERVEIVRGPYSSLYGANAFGGVINVITREGYGRPDAKVSLETGYPFSVLHSYTTDERGAIAAARKGARETYWNFNGSSSGGNDRFNFLAAVGYRTIGNYLLRDYAISRVGTDTLRLRNVNYDYHDFRAFGKCGLVVNDRVSLNLNLRYFNSELGFGRTRKIKPDSADIITSGEKLLLGPTAKFKLADNLDLHLGGYYRRVNGGFWNEELDTSIAGGSTYVRSYWKSNSDDGQIESRLFWRPAQAHTVTAGFEALRNYIHFGATRSTLTEKELKPSRADGITNLGVFVQDELVLLDRLNIVPGVRYDYHSEFGGAVCPKLGVSYKLVDALRVRSSIGRAFRAPTLSELYMPDLRINPSFVMRANPELKPEYIWAGDGAVEWMPVSNLRVQAGGFFNAMRDLVVPRLASDKQAVTHANVSTAWSRGVETELEWQPLDWLNLTAGYVFQKSRDEEASELQRLSGGKTPEVPLDYIPEHTVNLGLQVEKKLRSCRLSGSVSQTFVAVRSFQDWTGPNIILMPVDNDLKPVPPVISLDPYGRTDAALTLHLPWHCWVGIFGQNILNAVYEESAGTLAAGMFLTLKLGAEF
jgi:outer membrane cobalamin receptor